MTDFIPPADSAINVRDFPGTTIVRTWDRQGSYYHVAPGGSIAFVYQTADLSHVYLAAPEANSGRWAALWVSHNGVSKYAEDITAKDALRCALWPLAQTDRALAHSVMTALLTRKTEAVWRGRITDERIAADHDAAILAEAMRGPVVTVAPCTDAAGYVSGPVTVTPSCEVEIEAAARRVLAIQTVADLDRAATLCLICGTCPACVHCSTADAVSRNGGCEACLTCPGCIEKCGSGAGVFHDGEA